MLSNEDLRPAVSLALEDLQLFPCPTVPSPKGVPKRASVALILRVQPNPAQLPTPGASSTPPSSISEFFAQPWVEHGEVEVLFIKRAARQGDRWTSHVAFPGGKRDAGDADDFAAAVRETLEEVGLNLETEPCLRCGHLPDRVVRTSWGTIPLMVLCPFVFLLTSHTAPALHLQPTEVASAHWVPLRLLLDPRFRTVERCDVSDRLARKMSGVLGQLMRQTLRLSLGSMEFSAIRLWPSQSVFSTFGSDFMEPAAKGKWECPLVLWGLTLGMVQDFLDMLPPVGGAVGLWKWPTFTAVDVRFVVAAMTRRLKKRNLRLARKEGVAAAMMKDVLPSRRLEESVVDVAESSGSEDGEYVGASTVLIQGGERERISSVDTLLEGYFDTVRKAVWFTLAGRAIVGIAVVGALASRW